MTEKLVKFVCGAIINFNHHLLSYDSQSGGMCKLSFVERKTAKELPLALNVRNQDDRVL